MARATESATDGSTTPRPPSSRTAAAFVSGTDQPSDATKWCATFAQPSIAVTKRYFTAPSATSSIRRSPGGLAANVRRKTRSVRTPSSRRPTRSLSTTGDRLKPLPLAFPHGGQLVEVDQPGVGLPGDARGRIVLEEQPAVQRDAAGEPEWRCVEDDQVHTSGEEHLPGGRRFRAPPRGDVEVAVGSRPPGRSAAVDERESRTRSSQRGDHGSLVELHQMPPEGAAASAVGGIGVVTTSLWAITPPRLPSPEPSYGAAVDAGALRSLRDAPGAAVAHAAALPAPAVPTARWNPDVPR